MHDSKSSMLLPLLFWIIGCAAVIVPPFAIWRHAHSVVPARSASAEDGHPSAPRVG